MRMDLTGGDAMKKEDFGCRQIKDIKVSDSFFTYVKNKEYELRDTSHEVAGMLLYAKTDEEIIPNQKYKMSGNKISVKTLALNLDFGEIRKRLEKTELDKLYQQSLREAGWLHFLQMM